MNLGQVNDLFRVSPLVPGSPGVKLQGAQLTSCFSLALPFLGSCEAVTLGSSGVWPTCSALVCVCLSLLGHGGYTSDLRSPLRIQPAHTSNICNHVRCRGEL